MNLKISDNPFSFVRDNLRGLGCEAGSLHNSFPINEKTQMIYCDYMSQEELREQYKNDKLVDITKIKPQIKIKDMTDMSVFPNNYFDFVCNSHIVEHSANMLKAVQEFLRITKPNGFVFMIIPSMDYCFDKDRVLTTPQHIVDDFNNNVTTVEMNHYTDYFSHVPFPDGTIHPELAESAFNNGANIHVHTFLTRTLKEIFEKMESVLRYKLLDINQNMLNIGVLLQKDNI
jgi:ubiquinone/menaquinone biosynthesis C-methylase UbiE